MPRLEVFQSLWAMEGLGPDGSDDPLQCQIERIAEAGFDGVGLDHAARTPPSARELARLAGANSLGFLITAFPASLADVKSVLSDAAEHGARLLIVNARFMPRSLEDGADFVRRCLDAGEKAGVPVLFETHRCTLTNDLFYLLDLLARAPDLRLAADLSHVVVAREAPMPLDAQHSAWFETLLARSDAFQGRVSSREQVQMPLDAPQNDAWLAQYLAWWARGFRSWLGRAGPGEIFNFMCELGPPPYAITTQAGAELSDRWREAIWLKDQAHGLWAGALPPKG